MRRQGTNSETEGRSAEEREGKVEREEKELSKRKGK
jgi:hypothetical protein